LKDNESHYHFTFKERRPQFYNFILSRRPDIKSISRWRW